MLTDAADFIRAVGTVKPFVTSDAASYTVAAGTFELVALTLPNTFGVVLVTVEGTVRTATGHTNHRSISQLDTQSTCQSVNWTRNQQVSQLDTQTTGQSVNLWICLSCNRHTVGTVRSRSQ